MQVWQPVPQAVILEISIVQTMALQSERVRQLRHWYTIPVDVINNVTGERYSTQISLAYDGVFGFTAVLSINMEAENVGLYANLFYYNEMTGELEFICADKIAEDGTAELVFTHASDYTIVIDTEPMDGSIVQTTGEVVDNAEDTITDVQVTNDA